MLAIKIVTTEGEALNIVRELFTAYQQELDEDLCFQSFNDELKDPLKKYGPPSGTICLAYYNDVPAGCIALMPLPDEQERKICEMKRLYVKPDFRSKKIGVALVEKLLNTAKELGYQTMKLDTLQKLQPAIRLYKQYGFTETTSYYKNPLPEVVYMQKEL